MATKRNKKPSKKVKSLKAKSLSADKARRVRGGATFGVKSQYKPAKLTEPASLVRDR